MKYKAHTIYKNQDGKRLPGVTTITGLMDKPALKYWANGLGLNGIDVRKYVDDMADIGTLAHQMAEDAILGNKTITDDYSKNQIDLAENCLLKFYEWLKDLKYEVIFIENQLVSEKYQYGGTCDMFLRIDGKNILIDIKTCKAIYDEMETQVAAYKMLIEENGNKVDECYILRIGRSEDEGFEYRKINKIDLHEQRFINLREQYELNRQIRSTK